MSYLAAVIGGYLAGSIPTGYWLVRIFRGIDIRRVGSRSIGATNVWRAMGWKLGVPTIVVDVLKGLVPALVASLLVDDLAGVLAGVRRDPRARAADLPEVREGRQGGRDDGRDDGRPRAARRARGARSSGR